MSFYRRNLCLGILIFFILAVGPHANAEDDADAVLLSCLHAIPAGTVKVAASSIALRRGTGTVSMATQAEDGAAIIDVNGPAFKWLGEQDTYPDRQFPELQISIDHIPANLHDHSSASFDGKDITGELKEAGIDLFAISQSPPVLFSNTENQKVFDQLLEMGAIGRLAGQDVAAWSAKRDVSFRLGKGAHLVTLQYTARPAVTLLPPAQLVKALPLGVYCLSATALRRAAARAAKSGYVLAAQYTIPAGIDGGTGGAVAVDIANPGGAKLPAVVAFFCAPDGKPMAAKNGAIKAPARPDASGVVHILTLGSAERD